MTPEPTPKWGDLWGIDPDYTRDAPIEVALPADDTPEHTLLVQELAETMVQARAAYTGPGFSTWPTAMHAQAAAAITHLRGETP